MASGIINGSCTGSSALKYSFWIEWSSNADAVSNTSVVNATSYVQRNDGYSSSAYNNDVLANSKTITINGAVSYSTSKGIDTRNSAKVLIASGQTTVTHDGNGYATINISSSFPSVASSLTGGSASADVTLDVIDPSTLNITNFDVITYQTEAVFNFEIDSTADYAWYSLNGGISWNDLPVNNIITGLSPNTLYNFKLRLRKQSNQSYAETSTISKKTLPIYITDISISDKIVLVGDTVNLSPEFTPSNASIKSLNYTQNNDFYIIKSNILTAKSQGNFTITAISTDDSGISTTFNLTINQSVTGITADNLSITLPIGSSSELGYRILPENATNKNVIITNSDDTVVDITGTVATGISNGTSIITITTVDGSFSISITINVTGENVWYDYNKPIDILNYNDIDKIHRNMQTIRTTALTKGLTIDALILINARYSSELNDMFDILQNSEYNLDKLQNAIYSIYYKNSVSVGEKGINKSEIWRIIQCINDYYLIATNKLQKWQKLNCTDGTPTVQGKYLIVRGEYIG